MLGVFNKNSKIDCVSITGHRRERGANTGFELNIVDTMAVHAEYMPWEPEVRCDKLSYSLIRARLYPV